MVLPRVLDDATVASLNSIVHANNGVVSYTSNLLPYLEVFFLSNLELLLLGSFIIEGRQHFHPGIVLKVKIT